MGDGRSLASLVALYVEQRQISGKVTVPTVHLRQLEQWSTTFGWQARLLALADQAAAAAEAAMRRERASVFEEGLSLDFERVRVLKRLAQRLIDDLMSDEDDEPRDPADVVNEVLAEVDQVLKGTWSKPTGKRRRGLWLNDIKSIGSGKGQRLALLSTFNASEIETLRGLLDDIAKETGGRPKTVKIDVEQRLRVVAEEEGVRLGLTREAALEEADALLREMRRARGRR